MFSRKNTGECRTNGTNQGNAGKTQVQELNKLITYLETKSYKFSTELPTSTNIYVYYDSIAQWSIIDV